MCSQRPMRTKEYTLSATASLEYSGADWWAGDGRPTLVVRFRSWYGLRLLPELRFGSVGPFVDRVVECAMEYYENILGLVGRTALVRLNRLAEGLRATVLAKMENHNPGGSVKDRIGV